MAMSAKKKKVLVVGGAVALAVGAGGLIWYLSKRASTAPAPLPPSGGTTPVPAPTPVPSNGGTTGGQQPDGGFQQAPQNGDTAIQPVTGTNNGVTGDSTDFGGGDASDGGSSL